MDFENVKKGVGNIFVGEILGLIGALLMAVTAILGAVVVQPDGPKALSTAVLVCGMGGILFMLVSYILNIVGVKQASNDEDSFRVSLYAAIFGIIFSLLSGFFSNAAEGNDFAQRIISTVPDIINLIMMIYVIVGIGNVAAQLHNQLMVDKGRTILNIIFIMEMIIFVLRAISGMVRSTFAASMVIGVLAFAGFLSVVTYIMYLSYLRKAKKMLA